MPIMMYPNLDYHNLESQILYNKIDKFQIRQNATGDIRILLKMKDKADDIPVLPSGKEDYCVSDYEYKG